VKHPPTLKKKKTKYLFPDTCLYEISMLLCEELTPEVSRGSFRHILYSICSQLKLKLIARHSSLPSATFKTINGDREVSFTNNKPVLHTHTHTHIYIYTHINLKCSHYRPAVVQRVGIGIALLYHDRSTRRG